MSLPKLVVFDMAGTTVVDGEGVVANCLVAAMEAGGFPTTHAAATAQMGLPKPLAIRALLGDAATGDLIVAIHADFVARMLTFYRTDAGVGPIPGAEEAFATLRASGVLVALDTGFSRDIADAIIERLGWSEKIDGSVTSDEVENGRPHPDMIYALMHRFGIAEVSLVAKVGDTPSDLYEGTSAGCGWVIGVTEGSHTREQLLPHLHTHLIPSVAHLSTVWGN